MPPEGYTSVTLNEDVLGKLAQVMQQTGAESYSEAIEISADVTIASEREISIETETDQSDVDWQGLGRQLLWTKIDEHRGDLYQAFDQFSTRLAEDKEIRDVDVQRLAESVDHANLLVEQLEEAWDPYPGPKD